MSLPQAESVSDSGSPSDFNSQMFLSTSSLNNESFKKPPIPISPEFDYLMESCYVNSHTDRGLWLKELLEKHPQIANLRQRVMPLDRAAEFGRIYLSKERYIDQNALLSMISQHLRIIGLVETLMSLNSEWEGTLEYPKNSTTSQLTTAIQRGVMHAERFYELTMPGTRQGDVDQKLLNSEMLRVLGLSPYKSDISVTFPSSDPPGSEHITFKDEGRSLRAVSLDKLIWILTSDSPFYSDELLYSFCLLFRTYTNPHVLLKKLRIRQEIARSSEDLHSLDLINRFLNVWIIENYKSLDYNSLTEAKKMIGWTKIPVTDSKPAIDLSQAPKVDLGANPTLWDRDFDEITLPPTEFARQLTLYTAKYFFAIERSEYLDHAWDNPGYEYKAPNIRKINTFGDTLSSWVCAVILKPESELVQRWDRTKIIEYFVDVAKALYEMHNYLCCIWIFSVFDQSPIHRLTKIVEKGTQREQRWFTKKKDILLNFQDNNRKPIEESMKGLATNEPTMPALPYFLNRIAKHISGNKPTFNDQIDLSYMVQLWNMVYGMEQFQKRRYAFLEIEQAQEFFEHIPHYSNHELDALSRAIEPPAG